MLIIKAPAAGLGHPGSIPKFLGFEASRSGALGLGFRRFRVKGRKDFCS